MKPPVDAEARGVAPDGLIEPREAEVLRCSSLASTPNGDVCTDGFPATPACWGAGLYFGPGKGPLCCREEWCGRVYETSGGSPPWHLVERNRAAARALPPEVSP